MHSITAIIPTYNEEDHINDVISSVSWCDKVLVIDSFSTDRTEELARTAGAEVVQRKYDGPADQKNHAIGLVKTEWVIILDADERMTEKLISEVKDILSQDSPTHKAYWIYRRNHFMGKEIKYSGWQSDKVIRLFKKGACVYEAKQVHEEMECDSEVGVLKHKLLHYTYKNFSHYMEKFDRYTTWSAQDRAAKTSKVTALHLVWKPLFRFFRHYILKLGFLDGKEGLIISILSSYSVFLRYLKLERIKKGEEL